MTFRERLDQLLAALAAEPHRYPHAELARAEEELRRYAEAESADAAAGSYAGRAERVEAQLARARKEVARWKRNTLEPQTMRAVSDIGRALDEPGPEYAIAQPGRWLHIDLTSPDATTANTSALALRDHLTAEFPGVSMQITTNAAEDEPVAPAETALREQLHAAIGREVYEYRERNPLWGETEGVTEEIARLATRGAMEVPGEQPDPPAWTPPPPGSTAEQLPDHLLDLIRDRLPDYTSTACQTADTVGCAACYPGSGVPRPQYDEIREHAERLHNRCRINHKFTGQLCACGCHPEEQQL